MWLAASVNTRKKSLEAIYKSKESALAFLSDDAMTGTMPSIV